MKKPLIVISRNPASYLSGHSIFAWQLSEFLAGVVQTPVLHITHATAEGPRHSVEITPSVSALLYQRIEVEYHPMEKLPHSLSSCVVADEVDAVLEKISGGVSGVLAISPLNYLADVVNVCQPSETPVVSLLRGTDTLLLTQSWGETSAGRRYRRSLDACRAVFTVSQWLHDLAKGIGIAVTGVVAPVTFHPFSAETIETDADQLLRRILPRPKGKDERLVVFAGRMAAEKGALQVADVMGGLLDLDSSFVAVMAGSGPEEKAVAQRLAPHVMEGRAWVGPLSFPKVLALATRTDLMVMGSGLEKESMFTEAISSSTVTFAAAGTPVLFSTGPRSGGITEAVGDENRRWCESLSSVEVWPEAITDLFRDSLRRERITAENRSAGAAFKINAVLADLMTSFGISLPS